MAEHPDIALVRRGYDAFQRGDRDTLSQLLTRDVVHHVPGDGILAGHHKGIDAVLELYRRFGEETNGTFTVALKDVYADGRGHCISVHESRAERNGRGLEMRGGLFFTIVGGKVTDIDECVMDIDADNEFWS